MSHLKKVKYPNTKRRLISLAVASACAAQIAPAYAQAVASDDEPAKVIVSGLRASLQ
jgi:hypothetical protein